MAPFTLIWLTAIVFVALAFWGVNVPTSKRSPGVIWVVAILALFNLVAQSYFYRGLGEASSGASAEKLVQLQKFIHATTFVPGTLRNAPPVQWYKAITSSLLHFGWAHLLVNAWFFVLFGHVIEQVFGLKKFLLIVAMGLTIPPLLEGFFGTATAPAGGLGGVVYAIMGAFLVCFPRSRCYGAVNYDLKFWAAILFIILPITMVTRYAGMTLTEPVMMMGILGFFLLIQPEHARISAAAGVVVLYKLLLDFLLIEPAVREIAGNSAWRVLGGFGVGITCGFMLNGIRGWRMTWTDETTTLPSSSRGRSRMTLAQLEAAAHKDEEAARAFLGQRVFVGDSARASAFYRDVVMTKFPDLMLPLQEQMALARVLQFKGYEKEALTAFEALLKNTPSLPDEYWVAWLKAAELITKLDHRRQADASKYLDRFEEGPELLLRDRIEAERLRSALTGEVNATPLSECLPPPADAPMPPPLDDPDLNYGIIETPDHITDRTKTRRPRKPKDAEPIQFPRTAPRTFTYTSDATTPAKLSPLTAREKMVPTDPAELLRAHWKPLPCMAEKKPMHASIIERPIKNPRIAEDQNKPSMYSSGMRPGREVTGKKGGRLSRLELAQSDTTHTHSASNRHATNRDAMPSRYGGLDEHKKAGAPPHTGFKLRGEKDSAATPRQKINRHAPPPKKP